MLIPASAKGPAMPASTPIMSWSSTASTLNARYGPVVAVASATSATSHTTVSSSFVRIVADQLESASHSSPLAAGSTRCIQSCSGWTTNGSGIASVRRRELLGRHLGRDDVDEHARALLEAGGAGEPGDDVHVPVEVLVALVVRRGVEHHVVGHVADGAAEALEARAQRSPDRDDIRRRRLRQVGLVLLGDHEHLVRCAAPEGADGHD